RIMGHLSEVRVKKLFAIVRWTLVILGRKLGFKGKIGGLENLGNLGVLFTARTIPTPQGNSPEGLLLSPLRTAQEGHLRRWQSAPPPAGRCADRRPDRRR